MQSRHVTIIGVLLGLIILYIALRLIFAGAREAGQGSCLTGCCLFELGESLMDLGCGLIGCGGALATFVITILALKR